MAYSRDLPKMAVWHYGLKLILNWRYGMVWFGFVGIVWYGAKIIYQDVATFH